MRVHELAKALGLSSKDILAKLHELGVDAKGHMSGLDETAVALIREGFGGGTTEPASDNAAATAEATAPTAAPETVAAPEPTPPTQQKMSPSTPVPEPPVETEKVEEPRKTGKQLAAGVDKVIRVSGHVVVKELAETLGLRPNQLISELMGMNVLASINQRVEIGVAQKIAEKHGYRLEQIKKATDHKPVVGKRSTFEEPEPDDKPEDLHTRAPVVTFLGHVDHGKTSLLDRIRNAAVAAGEDGGITQHIGAYTIDAGGRSITFLDTPGHAAFTAMRARGANLTDIAVIVIAADDSIMPQTREAIQHAQAAQVALIIAINKTDLPTANPTRVMQDLQSMDLAPEDWGGETICVQVSAETGDGIDHLLEMILLQADLLELKANPERRASGYVIEAQMEPGMGPTAHLLIKRGTLKIGDAVVCGSHSGNVRALINDHGLKVKSAGPSTPVKCLGLSGVPEAGAEFRVFTTDRLARSVAEEAQQRDKAELLTAPKKASLESIFDQLEQEQQIELKAIVKADTQGSVEAICHALQDIRSDKVSLNIILSGTGNITVNDIMLASASNAIILGFHVATESGVNPAAKHEGVEIKLYSVIYELIDHVRDAMTGLLAPEIREKVVGHARVQKMFSLGKTGRIAGCIVVDGKVTRSHKVRVKRGDDLLYEGAVATLKRFQDDATEVRETQECGIRLDRDIDYDENDILEFYEVTEVKQSL